VNVLTSPGEQNHGMTDNTRERLEQWVSSVLDAATVSFAPPDDGQPGAGVSLYLFELAPSTHVDDARRRPVQLVLRYLVTTWAAKPEEAERLLLDLAFGAIDHSDFEVEFTPLSPATWLAFGVKPRPAFVLRVPVRRERRTPPVPRVRQPLVIQSVPAVPLLGVVLGPDDFPLAGASVQIPAMQLSTRTDAQGRFRFAALPVEPRAQHLRVSARGRTQDVTVAQPELAGEPVVIHFDLGEE
jgi:hypothetical protein